MTEQDPQGEPAPSEYGYVNEYFLSTPSNESQYDEYRSRGLIFTNNLYVYFREESQVPFANGQPNVYDYRVRPFGPAFTEFIEAHPDLVDRLKET